MKSLHSIFLSLTLLVAASSVNALATGPTFYGVNLNASLSTQTVTGSSSTVHTVHVNNKTIIAAVFATGTSGVLNASDLALVLGPAVNLDVINTSNDTIVSVIATTGSNSFENAIGVSSKSTLSAVQEVSDYEFTLPNVPAVQKTNYRLTAKVNVVALTLSKLSISFCGGDKNNVSGATFFQGTIKQTGKVYP